MTRYWLHANGNTLIRKQSGRPMEWLTVGSDWRVELGLYRRLVASGLLEFEEVDGVAASEAESRIRSAAPHTQTEREARPE